MHIEVTGKGISIERIIATCQFCGIQVYARPGSSPGINLLDICGAGTMYHLQYPWTRIGMDDLWCGGCDLRKCRNGKAL